MKRRIPQASFLKIVLCTLIVAASSGSVALAGWTNLGRIAAHGLRCAFFFDENVGLVAGEGADGVFTTTDGGVTWSNHILPNRSAGIVTQILMVDRMNGWLTQESIDGANGLYSTSDGGNTWQPVKSFTGGFASSVYKTPSRLIVTNRSLTGLPGGISADNGLTFIRDTLRLSNDIDFVDDLNGVVSGFNAHVWSRTQDGGKTFIRLRPSIDSIESWSVYAIKGTRMFVSASETESVVPSTVRRSMDFGATFQYRSNLAFNTTGHITGFKDRVLYVQSYYLDLSKSQPGIYRSMDTGRTWLPVGGPANDRDTRFVAMGCNGGIVIAFDNNGNIWKTRDGGDGRLMEPLPTPPLSENPLGISSPICSAIDHSEFFTNTYCSDVQLLGIRFADSTDPLVKTGAITIARHPVFPTSYVTGVGDSIRFEWVPGGLYHSDTTVKTNVILKFYSPSLKDTLYSVLPLTLAARPGEPKESIGQQSFVVSNVVPCIPFDTTIVVTNKGCDILHITGSDISNPGFQLLDSTKATARYSYDIKPGDSVKFVIRLSVVATGTARTQWKLHLLHQGLSHDSSVTLSVNVLNLINDSKFITSIGDTIRFDTLTRCDKPKDTSFVIRNPGCTPLTIHGVRLLTPGVIADSTAKNFPVTVTAGSSLVIRVTLTPSTVGAFETKLRVRYNLTGQPTNDTIFTITSFTKYGTRTLALDTVKRNLDSILFCAQKDTTVTVKNTGCDVLTVFDRSLVAGPFAILNPRTTPFTLQPGESDNIQVRFVPTQAGPSSGQLSYATDADSLRSRTVRFIAFAFPTDSIHLFARPNTDCVYAGDTAFIAIYSNASVKGKGLKSMEFDFQYNGDIMTYIPNSAGSILANTTTTALPEIRMLNKMTFLPIAIRSATDIPLTAHLPIIFARFAITLSDSLTTALSLGNLRLNNNDPIFGRCLLGAVSDTVALPLCFRCGDSILRRYLIQRDSFSLPTGIIPNGKEPYPDPFFSSSGTELHIPFRTTEAAQVTLEVFDEHARRILEKEKTCSVRGDYEFQIGWRELPEGNFRYAIRSGISKRQMQGGFVRIK